MLLANRYRMSDQVVVDRLGDSLVAVQLGTDKIFELNETATRLVELLGENHSAGEAARQIANEYGVPVETVVNDVVLTIENLVSEAMIEAVAHDS